MFDRNPLCYNICVGKQIKQRSSCWVGRIKTPVLTKKYHNWISKTDFMQLDCIQHLFRVRAQISIKSQWRALQILLTKACRWTGALRNARANQRGFAQIVLMQLLLQRLVNKQYRAFEFDNSSTPARANPCKFCRVRKRWQTYQGQVVQKVTGIIYCLLLVECIFFNTFLFLT